MARRNPELLAQLKEPLEVIEEAECGACETIGLVVAAKWPNTPEELWLGEMEAEYLCPVCHIVFQNVYDGPGTGDNFYSEMPSQLLGSAW